MTTRTSLGPCSPPRWSAALAVGLTGADGDRRRPSAPDDGAPGIGDPYWPLDGNGGIDVASYAISHRYALATKRLSGRTRVELTATQDLRSFSLDFLLKVSKVTVDGEPGGFDKTDGGHELRITPAEPLAAGTRHTVVVTYADHPGEVLLRRGAQLAGQHGARSSR